MASMLKRDHACGLTRVGAAALCALALTACPDTTPTPVMIGHVDVVGDPASNDFVLHITGSGFGPTSLTYDLSTGKGTASTDVHLEIFASARPETGIPVPRELLTIPTPSSMDAAVKNHPLAAGVYGLRLFAEGTTSPLASANDLFRVEVAGGEDSGLPPDRDAGTQPGPDAGDAGTSTQDATLDDATSPQPDAEPPDVGPPDSGIPPDSGLGPFTGAFRYRRAVLVNNASSAVAPQGTTLRIPIPHQDLVTLAHSKPDGTDLELYYGTTPLAYQWDDQFAVNTNQLAMIARLPADAPIGALSQATPLVLYYGDPLATIATTDGVFEFSERFEADVSGAWHNNAWNRCNYERPLQVNTAAGQGGAYCTVDSDNASTRRTLATPNIMSITNGIAANQTYELSFWTAGRMENQTNDLFYFAYGPSNAVFNNTTLLPTASYLEFPPNVAGFQFVETDNTTRTVDGWRFPAGTMTWWTRARAPFVPNQNAPTLHFRFISKDNNANTATTVIIDDFTVRLALSPELGVQLGPEEAR